MYPVHTWFALARLRYGQKVDETAEPTAEPNGSEPRPPGSDAEVVEAAETTEIVP